ncbi:2-amino-4-hydroxy-6-hydroxymethyldihydropteridine diphosphokinase [Streptomyces cinereospinus]
MTASFTEGHSDPTVQPVPASVVEKVDAADTTLHNPQRAVISIGANLGNRLETLQGAIDALEDTPGGTREGRLPRVRDGGVGRRPRQPAVVLQRGRGAQDHPPPSSLLERAHAVEEAFHRTRDERWGPRTLDVDIVSYADVVSDDPALTLPHPRAHERAFVLAPWHDVDPDAQLPGRGAVAELLGAVTREGVAARGDLELRLPE